MKAILISIKPKHVAKILNGRKTIEVRKTCPKQLRGDTPVKPEPIDVYIYCTKDNHQLVKPKDYDKYLLFTKGAVDYSHEHTLNGKVVAKFTLNKVEEITNRYCKGLLVDSCLKNYELNEYLGNNNGYAWHVDNLIIFDKPKELSEFRGCSLGWNNCIPHNCKECPCSKPLTKAPQSWCYVEVVE